jgi:hypothetical protein
MQMKERADFRISRLRHLKSLSSPIRQEIVDTVNALGTCSVPEIAAALGRPADALYYHVRALRKSGLLVSAGKRQNNRHVEALVRPPTRRVMRLQYAPDDPGNVTEVNRIVRGMLRGAGRDFERGFQPSLATVHGKRRNLNASRQKAWLAPEELAEVNQLLGRLQQIFHSARRQNGTEFCSLTFVMAPLECGRRETG